MIMNKPTKPRGMYFSPIVRQVALTQESLICTSPFDSTTDDYSLSDIWGEGSDVD